MQDVPHAIMFHHFWDAQHVRGQGAISADELDALLRFVGSDRLVDAATWRERALKGTFEGWEIGLTFDDGLKCQFDVAAPVLADHGLTAFWFIYTAPTSGVADRLEVYRYFRTKFFPDVDEFYAAFFSLAEASGEGEALQAGRADFDAGTYLGQFPFYSVMDRWFRYARDEILGPQRYYGVMDAMMTAAGLDAATLRDLLWMSPNDIRSLHDDGHIVGLHSHTHPTRIERMSAQEQRQDYLSNYSALSEILGDVPRTMSHPCNSYNAHTPVIMAELDVTLGFRANMAHPVAPSALEWPREDHANIMARMSQ